MCNTSSHQLQEGDVVLFATDGVWDNVSAQEILRGVSSKMLDTRSWKIREGRDEGGGGITASSKHLAAATQQNTPPGGPPLHTALARTVMRMAKSASTNTKRDGPFAKDVQRLFPGENYRGGKVDDITVIVTVVAKYSPA
jgi:protein phosphatase PTC7